MKKIFLLSIFIILFTSRASSQTFSSIEGVWYGKISVMGTELRLSYTIANVNDTLRASMASIDQGVSDIPMGEVSFDGSQLIIVQSKMMLEYNGVVNENFSIIEGIYRQAGQEFELNLGREKLQRKIVKRPQEPKKPYPYYTEEVLFENKAAGITLAGTLSLPSEKGKFPVVILISGSGAQDRNEELLGHKPFLVLSDYLTRNGIGVLRFDDRGTAKSTGNHTLATSADFATDVEAGINFLKKRKDIDKKKIGLIGHSEGGLIAPMVAVNKKEVAFIVLLAGPGIPGDEILLEQGRLIALAEGADTATVEKNTAEAKILYDIIKQNSKEVANEKLATFMRKEIEKLSPEEKKLIPDAERYINRKINVLNNVWFRYFLAYNPRPILEKVTCPVLAINGEKDLQVPYEVNLNAIKKALKTGGNKNYKTEALPNLNHLFQTTETGAISEYGEIEETISPKVLKLVTNWIVEVVK